MKFNLDLLTLLPLVVHGIQTAEGINGATGAEKKARAVELVRVGLTGVETASGKHPLDIPEAATAVDHGIDAVVSMVNAVKRAKAA